jgi:hypothetical protein
LSLKDDGWTVCFYYKGDPEQWRSDIFSPQINVH